MPKIGPTGARKNRKATVKKRRNTAPGFIRLDPKNQANCTCEQF